MFSWFSYLQKKWIVTPSIKTTIYLLFFFVLMLSFLHDDKDSLPKSFSDFCTKAVPYIVIIPAALLLGLLINLIKHFLWASDFEKGKNYYKGIFGIFSKPNYDEAAKYFFKAAEKGDARAQYYLGCCYRDGYGVSVDEKEATKWFRQAAELGDAKAQWEIGRCYEEGESVPRDYEEAVKWYQKAAVQVVVGMRKEKSESAQKELKKALPALYALGRCYEEGRGVPKDVDEAEKWYRKAVQYYDKNALERLKALWGFKTSLPEQYDRRGKTIEVTPQKKWGLGLYIFLFLVIVILYVGCNNWLGDYYFEKAYNYEKEQNYEEAFKWYHKAAERGNAPALCNIGYCYDMGQGVPQDYKEAVKWYRLAAEKDNAMAKNNLGWCYENGQGVPQDYKEAVRWYRLAAEQDNKLSYENLGDCYVKGHGVPKDTTAAIQYYQKAAELGNKDAQEKVEKYLRTKND